MLGFSKRIRVARGLLKALSTMCACAAMSGCLWPDSLTDAVTTGDNVRPVFSAADPPFGEILSSPGQVLELKVTAEDPNPDVGDVLHVREFKLAVGDTTRVYTGFEITLTHQSNTTDAYSGSFQLSDLCGNFHDGAEVFVVVAD